MVGFWFDVVLFVVSAALMVGLLFGACAYAVPFAVESLRWRWSKRHLPSIDTGT